MTSPRRRAWTAALVVVVALAAAPSVSSPAGRAAEDDRPNVLVIVTDDLATGDLAVMPHLRELLTERGTSFSNFFVSVSLCCPSRASMLRGQYAHNTGVLTNAWANGGFPVARQLGVERSTIATWLQDEGYRTGLIGKYLNYYPQSAGPTYLPPGWDEWYSPVRGTPSAGFEYTLNENGRLVRYGSDVDDYVTDVYVRLTEQFVTGAADAGQPFFAWLAVEAPHDPATPAPQDADAFAGERAPRTPSYNQSDVSDMPQWIRELPPLRAELRANDDLRYRRRRESLLALDRQLVHLTDTLERNGQLDNTYLVFTSDNGFHLGQHRLSGGKQTAYDEDVRVPLIVRGPGVAEGATSSALVGNIDLAPTFAELAGAPFPDFVDGRPFTAQLDDPATPTDRRSFLLEHWRVELVNPDTATPGSFTDPVTPVATRPATVDDASGEGSAFPESPDPPDFRGLRTDRYTYVEYVTGDRELYDDLADPDQLRNLAQIADPALISRLSRRLAALENCRAAACRRAEDLPVPDP